MFAGVLMDMPVGYGSEKRLSRRFHLGVLGPFIGLLANVCVITNVLSWAGSATMPEWRLAVIFSR